MDYITSRDKACHGKYRVSFVNALREARALEAASATTAVCVKSEPHEWMKGWATQWSIRWSDMWRRPECCVWICTMSLWLKAAVNLLLELISGKDVWERHRTPLGTVDITSFAPTCWLWSVLWLCLKLHMHNVRATIKARLHFEIMQPTHPTFSHRSSGQSYAHMNKQQRPDFTAPHWLTSGYRVCFRPLETDRYFLGGGCGFPDDFI